MYTLYLQYAIQWFRSKATEFRCTGSDFGMFLVQQALSITYNGILIFDCVDKNSID